MGATTDIYGRFSVPPEGLHRISAYLRQAQEPILREKGEQYPDDPVLGFGSDLRAFLSSGELPPVSVLLSSYSRDHVTYSNPSMNIDGWDLSVLDGGYDEAQIDFSGKYVARVTVRVYSTMITVAVNESYSSTEDTDAEAETLRVVAEIVREYAPPPAPEPIPAPRKPFKVFIGHGGDEQWRILRDELRDAHGFDIEAYEGTPRAGHSISGILQTMASNSTAALLILTKTDAMARSDADGTNVMRGRQNVVHEIGYFQGRLGWQNAIVVVEEGVELFTNLDGTQQIRFPSGQIRAAVGQAVGSLGMLKAAYDRGA